MEIAARIGWLARGAIYLLVAALVARLAGGGEARADKSGAFQTLAKGPFGGWTLGLLTAGFVVFAVWRTWAAIRGTDEKPGRRLGWIGSAIAYAILAFLALGVLLGDGGSKRGGEQGMTAKVMGWPGGRFLVGAVGILIIGIAANYVRKGIKEKFLHDVDEGAVPDSLHTGVRAVGLLGWLGRALVFGLVGWFVIRAAWQADPKEPIGLDQALHRLAGESWGPLVLWVAVGGMLAFALLCAATAAWPDPDPDG
jgi:hypothetical protein